MNRHARIAYLTRLALQGIDHADWYDCALQQVTLASATLHTSPSRLAALLALFSPRVPVRRSIRLALHYVHTGQFTADTMRPVQQAVLHWEQTGQIRGPKTSAFCRAILGDTDAIVLDVWMSVAFGVDQGRFTRAGVRRYWERQVRIVAERIGRTPRDAQAAIWAGIVRQHRRSVGQLTLVEQTLFGSQLVGNWPASGQIIAA